MQDIHAFGGGRIFNAGGGGDRRLYPHNQTHKTLKCPRCDSLNTKFCYYNNYNLSQPRHFCKSCRRYWTKGGVLRNVPVGGAFRKAKRAKSKHSADSSAAAAPTQPQQARDDHSKANSHSSSESSSTLAGANSNVVVASASASSSAGGCAGAARLLKSNESKFMEQGLLEQGSGTGIFREVGDLTSLTNYSSSKETMAFDFSSILNQEGAEQWQGATQMSAGLMDELPGLHSRSGLDWQGGGDQSLFDLANTLDQTYWSQTQWTDKDHSGLYLP